MSTDNLTDLLNRVSAIVKSGASSFPLLAQETKIPVRTLYDIVNLRRCRPTGDRTMALLEWAGHKTLQISMGGRATQKAYRKAYAEVSKRFPVACRE
jgi:hypothetical protein